MFAVINMGSYSAVCVSDRNFFIFHAFKRQCTCNRAVIILNCEHYVGTVDSRSNNATGNYINRVCRSKAINNIIAVTRGVLNEVGATGNSDSIISRATINGSILATAVNGIVSITAAH